jgi:hypothetical protein
VPRPAPRPSVRRLGTTGSGASIDRAGIGAHGPHATGAATALPHRPAGARDAAATRAAGMRPADRRDRTAERRLAGLDRPVHVEVEVVRRRLLRAMAAMPVATTDTRMRPCMRGSRRSSRR